MTGTPAQFRKPQKLGGAWKSAATMGCAVLVVGGCAAQRKPAIPWRTAVLVRPLVPETIATSDELADVPDVQAEIAQPEPVFVPRSGPIRPRVPTATPPANHETPSGKVDSPLIVPELSAQESNTLQRETEQSLNNAERNVAAATRRTLNATQTDLASKVRGFIADAREASKVGDWARARDLARKAQVLSEELANSL